MVQLFLGMAIKPGVESNLFGEWGLLLLLPLLVFLLLIPGKEGLFGCFEPVSREKLSKGIEGSCFCGLRFGVGAILDRVSCESVNKFKT